MRRISINGHGEYWEGWFHAWTNSGKAIVENTFGHIKMVDAHLIRFEVPIKNENDIALEKRIAEAHTRKARKDDRRDE